MTTKLLFINILYFLSSDLFAQINIVRANDIKVNQRYLETQSYFSNSSSGSVDPGTIKYSSFIPSFSGPTIRYFLIRKNNFWTIESYSSYYPGPFTKILYKQKYASNSNIPSCSLDNPWQIWTGGYGTDYFGPLPSPTFTGNEDKNLRLIGNCYLESSISSSISPNIFELPRLTNSDLSSIISPKNGSLFYDVTEKSIKVFQKNTWQKLIQENKNNFNPCINSTTIGTTSGGNFGPGISIINSINDNLNVFIAGRASSSLVGGVSFNNGIGLGVGGNNPTHNFIVKFDLNKMAQSVISLGNLNLTKVKSNGDFLYATGYFNTIININNQPYSPIGGSDAILLKIRKIDNSILWVKTFGGSSNEEGLDIVFEYNYIYWLGNYDNSSKKNGFIKKINDSDGNENLNAFINSSSNINLKSLAIINSINSNPKIFVLGTNESHLNVIGPNSTINFNASQGTGAFLINFNSELNPNSQNNLIISNLSTTNQLSLSNLEIIKKNKNGEYITSFRFGVNASNSESQLLNHTFYGGSLLLTTPVENVNNFSEIVSLNYFKIANISKNFVLGNVSTSSANINETSFFGNYEGQSAILKFNANGDFDGSINGHKKDDYASLSISNLLFINGKIEIPVVMAGTISFGGLDLGSGIRNSIRWWTLETCAGD